MKEKLIVIFLSLAVFIGLIFLADSSPVQSAGECNGLVSYWKMDETSGNNVADSQDGHPGTATAANIVDGKINKARSFSGGSNSDVNIPSVMGLGNTSITISAWVYLSGPTHGAFVKVGGTSGTNGYGIGVGNTTFDDNGNNLIMLYEWIRWIPTGRAIGTGWHHVAMVIDSSGVPTGYVDGSPVGPFSGSNPLAPSGNTNIGGYNISGFNRHATAVIDEVGVWNRALSGSEITGLYSGGVGKTCPEPSPTPTPSASPSPSPTNYFSVDPAGVVSSTHFSGNIKTKMSIPLWQVEDSLENITGFGNRQDIYNYDFFNGRVENVQALPGDPQPSVPQLNGLTTGAYRVLNNLTINNNFNLDAGEQIIILVPGNLRINNEVTVDPGEFLAFIVQGNITFEKTLGVNPGANPAGTKLVDGVYVTNGFLNTIPEGETPDTNKKFIGKGMFVAGANLDGAGGFNFDRDLGNNNSQYAAEYFEYRPDFLVNFPPAFGIRRITWREVAP